MLKGFYHSFNKGEEFRLALCFGFFLLLYDLWIIFLYQ